MLLLSCSGNRNLLIGGEAALALSPVTGGAATSLRFRNLSETFISISITGKLQITPCHQHLNHGKLQIAPCSWNSQSRNDVVKSMIGKIICKNVGVTGSPIQMASQTNYVAMIQILDQNNHCRQLGAQFSSRQGIASFILDTLSASKIYWASILRLLPISKTFNTTKAAKNRL